MFRKKRVVHIVNPLLTRLLGQDDCRDIGLVIALRKHVKKDLDPSHLINNPYYLLYG